MADTTFSKLKAALNYSFVVLLAVAPIMALRALNVREIPPVAMYRPALISSIISVLLWLLCRQLIKDSGRAAIFSATFTFLFLSYGHFTGLVNDGDSWLSHLVLWAGLISLPTALQWIAQKSVTARTFLTTGLNVLAVAMIAQSAYEMVKYPLAISRAISVNPIEFRDIVAEKPDVYYIILDAYTRADTLREMGFNNTRFVEALEQRGFYVATCSTSNYKFTTLSLSSALNMDYMWDVLPHENENDTGSIPIDKSIKQNRVRDIFTAMGYQTVAYETGYLWTEWYDADQYYRPNYNAFWNTDIQPFERLLIHTSGMRAFLDKQLAGFRLGDVFAYQAHAVRIKYTFESLGKLPTTGQPKFVFVHILAPHPPYIFRPDGSLNKDGDYFDLPNGLSTNDERNRIGYLNDVQFVNTRVLEAIDAILEKSSRPPIIIIQGDHGSWNSTGLDKFTILNAYYLPNSMDSQLYPQITPVNSFRVVFNQYFRMDYPLLKDLNINVDIGRPFRKRLAPHIPSPCD